MSLFLSWADQIGHCYAWIQILLGFFLMFSEQQCLIVQYLLLSLKATLLSRWIKLHFNKITYLRWAQIIKMINYRWSLIFMLHMYLPGTQRMDFHDENLLWAADTPRNASVNGEKIFFSFEVTDGIGWLWLTCASWKKKWTNAEIMSGNYAASFILILYLLWLLKQHSIQLENDSWNHFGLNRVSVNHCTILIIMFI